MTNKELNLRIADAVTKISDCYESIFRDMYTRASHSENISCDYKEQFITIERMIENFERMLSFYGPDNRYATHILILRSNMRRISGTWNLVINNIHESTDCKQVVS